MAKSLLAIALAMCTILPAHAEDSFNQADFEAIQNFIFAASSHQGLAQNVFDYCGPKNRATKQAQETWQEANRALLDDLSEAKSLYYEMFLIPEDRTQAEAQLDSIIERSLKRQSARLQERLSKASDQVATCTTQLRIMNSETMSFQTVSPESFAYWQERFGR